MGSPKSGGQPTVMSFVPSSPRRLHQNPYSTRQKLCYAIFLSCTFWFVLFRNNHWEIEVVIKSAADRCAGRYIYAHNIPGRFNADILRECHALSPWTDMCRFTSNDGLGPRLDNSGGVFSDSGWYATDQFVLDVVFHNRMKQYPCLTNDSSMASAIYVPFYAGLDISRYLWGYNISVRDSTSADLLRWLKSTPEWNIMGGHDHFLVAGRTTWEFRRLTDAESEWGGKFLMLPETKNMTVLVLESSPVRSNDIAVPYPTYFHPSEDSEVFAWQDRMRKMERPWLFSFAGAPRPNSTAGSIRDQIIGQCNNSSRCQLLKCGLGPSECHSPSSVMRMFQSSVFCMQPQGDTYTRRSTFDSMIAGCIPVFFHPGSAYVQYTWYLPKNYTNYSVYISEEEVVEGKVEIEQVLKTFSEQEVRAMREEVIRTIPRLIYGDPSWSRSTETVKDAFDVAVEGVLERVGEIRRILKQGLPFPVFEEADTWKRALGWTAGEHEWDRFFHHHR